MIPNDTLSQILGFIGSYRQHIGVGLDENDYWALAEIESDIATEMQSRLILSENKNDREVKDEG